MRLIYPVLIVLVLAGCQNTAPGKGLASSPKPAVTTDVARMGALSHEVVVSGPVVAREEMQIGVEVGGMRVVGVRAEVGDHVKPGQVLAELDARLLASELVQAQAGAQEAQAAEALAVANLARGQKLAASQMISASALDELLAARRAAAARSSSARAARNTVQLRRDFMAVRAPAAGVVSRRTVEAGQIAVAGTELFRVIKDGEVEWRPDLGGSELARVKVGDTVKLDGGLQAIVRAVAPSLDPQTRTGKIYAALPRDSGAVAGTFVQGHILTGTDNVLAVAQDAIVQRDGSAVVFVLDGVTVHRRVVVPGASSNGRTQIMSGLKDGDVVVAKGAGFLADGEQVRVVGSP